MYVSFDTNIIKNIKIPESMSCLSPFYFWQDHFIIVMTYSKIFYYINLQRPIVSLDIHSDEEVKNNFPHFYYFCIQNQYFYQQWRIYSNMYGIIYEEDNHIVYYDWANNTKVCTSSITKNYHDIVYYNGIFAFIAEENITFIYNKEIYIIDTPYISHMFAKACFENSEGKIFLITLIYNKSNTEKNYLLTYQLYV